MSGEARAAAEQAARDSYGRLVAILAARGGDLAAAEDALADAFAAALARWPVTGVPRVPQAWLVTAARRALGHDARARAVRARAAATLALLAEEAGQGPEGDQRLRLMFLCAHPAIDAAARTPLMLQAVLGLDAARIGAAFLTPPATMGQRLVRAKAKIRDARIPFVDPEPEQVPGRLGAVLAAVYAAFGTAWDAVPGAAEADGGLAEEALALARLVVEQLPREAEPRGLVALMLYCSARAAARRDAAGGFVPLDAQDWRAWDGRRIAEAEAHLRAAAAMARPGRFQTEAAIQSLHVQRAVAGGAPAPALAMLYDVLAAQAPTPGVLVARAAAHGAVRGAAAGLALLDDLAGAAAAYQPYWATRAHLLAAAGCDAGAAYARAVALTTDPALARFLAARAAAAEG